MDEIDCKIWEACRATSAASSFFSPIDIARIHFTYGAMECNNPIGQVLDEATEIWPDARRRIDRLVSIGTGKLSLKSFGDNLKELAQTLDKIAVETESVAERFELLAFRSLGLSGVYFRFNVSHGMEDIGLESYKKQRKVIVATNNFLNGFDVNRTCRNFAAASPCTLLTYQYR